MTVAGFKQLKEKSKIIKKKNQKQICENTYSRRTWKSRLKNRLEIGLDWLCEIVIEPMDYIYTEIV